MSNKPLLLVIDDEATILKTLKAALEDEQYQVETLEDGTKTLDVIGKLIPDLVLLDIFMPNVNGLNLLDKIKKEYPQQKVIIISGFGNIPMAIQAIQKGALDFIEKPFNLDDILTKISFLKNEKNFTKQKNIAQTESTENLIDFGIVGQSYLFQELIQQITQIATLKFPLLIYGQHGTGKTLLAQYVHKKNYSNLDNFFVVNCAEHSEKTVSSKVEDFIKKNSGTIFIKNIDELILDEQKKLLFLLESTKINNIRIIISSSKPLFELVENKAFNSTLFNKINITPIEIPTLNKRRYDIPLLAEFFLDTCNKKYNKSLVINTKALRMLRNLDWHENVAELKNLLEKIVCANAGSTIITDELLTDFIGEKKVQFIEEQSFLRFNSLKEATLEFEKKFILHLLKKNKYDIKQVCDRLNLTPVQLRDKMFKFDIEIKV
jgi:two-component system, NtrC family, nitrogen regulation response regulator NtrX